MNSITIKEIPIPSPKLSPNARTHYRVKANVTRDCREDSKICTMHAVSLLENWEEYNFPWSDVVVGAVWYRGRNTAIDADNALARLKAVYDGIVDSGVLSDDKDVTHLPIQFELDRKDPRLEVTISRRIAGECPLCGNAKESN